MKTPTQNESALVCAARTGDKEALQELLGRNWVWLRPLVYGVLGGGQDLEDVLQDVCVRVIDKIATLREPERFRAWLAVLARREAIRHSERRVKWPVAIDDEALVQQPDGEAQWLLERPEREEQYQQILAAVHSIPEKYREVFLLVHSGGLTYGQAGEVLDIPMTTVQIRLVRARRMILDRISRKDNQKVQQL